MKRTILILYTILCLVVALVPATNQKFAKATLANTWTVNDDATPPAHFHSIQEAINSASVLPGDTIFVYRGTYYENVVVNKSVSLVGENRDLTIINGNRTGRVIAILDNINDVKVERFTITNSSIGPNGSGIHVERSNGHIIRYNKIINNTYEGIGLYFSHNNIILGNTISSNYNGINLSSSNNNTISTNTISSNSYNGIFLDSSSSNDISGNTIFSNRFGIQWFDGIILTFSSNNVIRGNNITDNGNGISLYSSNNNAISSNTLSSNNYDGLVLALYSSNNVIYHNNFHDKIQASELTNFWDNGYEGNYWRNYTGQDLNRDGIGDVSHVVDVNNRDNYPLMGMFSDFTISQKEEAHHVYVICNSTISNFKFEIGEETGNKIVRFNVMGENGTAGFSRVTIPTKLMESPFIVIIGEKEVTPTLLSISNAAHVYLYFTYVHSNFTISIISSKTLQLYYELLDKYIRLQNDFQDLNATYYDLLNNYNDLSGNYTKLQDDYNKLDNSYQEHLADYSESMQNIRNLMYIFAATTVIFLMTTIYLSKTAHADARKNRTIELEK